MTTKKKPGRPRGQQQPSVRTTVTIPSETYQVVEALAEQKKVSMAWVVREAVDQYVSQQWPLLDRRP